MFSPDVALYGWLGSKHQLTNYKYTFKATVDKSIKSTPVTLKQSQVHQIHNENVDLEQGL